MASSWPVGFDRAGPECKRRYDSTWYKRCKGGGFAMQYGAILKREAVTADRAFGRPGSLTPSSSSASGASTARMA